MLPDKLHIWEIDQPAARRLLHLNHKICREPPPPLEGWTVKHWEWFWTKPRCITHDYQLTSQDLSQARKPHGVLWAHRRQDIVMQIALQFGFHKAHIFLLRYTVSSIQICDGGIPNFRRGSFISQNWSITLGSEGRNPHPTQFHALWRSSSYTGA